jgi:hypothetical protein
MDFFSQHLAVIQPRSGDQTILEGDQYFLKYYEELTSFESLINRSIFVSVTDKLIASQRFRTGLSISKQRSERAD